MSILTRSPSFSFRCPGIPCTTCSLIEIQVAAGYPWYPLNAGTAPWSRIDSSATLSSVEVGMPGRTHSRRVRCASPTTRQASLILSSSRSERSAINLSPAIRDERWSWPDGCKLTKRRIKTRTTGFLVDGTYQAGRSGKTEINRKYEEILKVDKTRAVEVVYRTHGAESAGEGNEVGKVDGAVIIEISLQCLADRPIPLD